MGAFMDRYNRMKGIGTVPDTVQADGEDSSSVPASEVKPGAFTERYNKLLEARAADMSHSLSEWSAANDTLAHSYGSYSVEELAKQTDALRTSGESLKQRIRDSGLYDDDTVTALGEGIDSWNRVHDIYRRDLDLAAGRAEREQATAKLPASSLPVYGRSPVTAHNGRESTLEDKILYAQASVDMLESKLENSKGKIPSPEQLMSGDAGIDGNDEIKAALKEKKKELEQLLKERQESEIAERREENGLSDGSHVPSSPAQDVEAVLSAKSEYFNPGDNKDPYGNDLRPAVNTVNNIARAGDRVKEAGDLAMSAFSAGIDRSIAGIGDAARTAYETVKGTAQRMAGVNQIPELRKYSPAAPEAKKSLTKRLEDAAVAGSRAADNYLLSGDTYTDRSEKDTVMQDYLYRRENRTLGKAGNVIADFAENFGYQMPNMLLTHGLGLTGLSSDAVTAIMFGSPAYVSNRRELLEEGYSSAEADLYGKAGFLIEGVGESLLGDAFGTVPAIGRKLGFSITDNITNPVVRTLMVYLAESGEEGLEEVAQSFLEAAAKSAITGEDFELDAREVAYEGILGAISGGVLGSIGLGQRLRAAGQVHAADVDYVNTLSVNAESVGTAAEAAGMIGALEKQRAALSKMTDETTGVEDTARRVKYLDTALETLSETLKEKFSLAAEITPQGGYEVKDKRNPVERAKDSLTADARSAGSVELALEAATRATDADSAAEAIAALEMQRQRISELGRTGFTARYEDRKMLEAEMKLRDRFGIDGTYFGASVDGKYTPEADGARYSIEQTDRGKPVVVIDTDILNGVPDADKKNAVRKFISQNYPNGIRVGNGVIEVTGKTGKEYTRSGYSQYIEKNDAQVYDDKLRAAGNLDEAVRASTDYVNEEIKHPRKDNIREFARGRVLMRVGQNDYNAEVVVGYTKNGEMLLYDIVNFKPDTFSVKERTPRQPGRGEAGMTGDYGKSSKVEGPIKSGPATTDNSISQNNAAVNSQYTQESENDASDTAENGADEGDFAVDRKGSDDSAAFSDEALDREGYTPTEQTRVIAMNEATRTGREYGASPAQQAAAEELSHILDRRVIFFRSDDPTVNGYYKNGTIHVNAASGRTVASIIASEMTHAIETTSDYGALRELALRELSREKGMSLDELRAQKKETYAAHGENLDADGVDFELCEEYVGRYLFGDVAQIRAAVDYKPSLGRKIIAFLDEIIRRLTGRVRAVSSRILKDAQYARELWGRAVREAKARGAESEARESGQKNSYSDEEWNKPITPRDVEAVQSIGRKSINAFTSEEIRKTQKWAHKFYRELGTKSPFFRAWFGDWRAHDTGEVKVAEIPEYAATNEARKANRGTVRNNDTGWDIRISRDGETNTISHAGGDKLSEYGLAGIRGLTENGVLLDSEVHEHHTNNAKNDMIAFDHKLYAVGRDTSGNVALYKITVEEAYHDHKNTNERRFHNLKYIEKVATVGGRTAGQSLPGVSTNDDIATTYTVADILSFVKTYDKDFTAAHDVSPELLNEDGTPKVFYHGTGANFTVFKSENGTYWFSESTDYAEAMAEERAGKNGRVGAFYLDMKNPYRAKLPPGQFTDPGYEKPIIDKAKSGGYDGVIIENDTDSDIEAETFYVVFSPNQIKSATDNIGTFDRGNNDIRYSIEDSGWDAYHRRNQEELESNTAAAERARREERAEERAAAEDEARRAAREEEALRRAEQEYAAAEEEGKNESDRAPEAPAWFDSMKKSGSVAEWVMSENNRRSSKLRRYITEHGTDSRDVSAADFAEAAVREIWDGAPASEGLDPELEAFLKEDVRTEIDRQSADLQRKIEEKRERQKKRIETEAEAVRDAKKIDRSADRLIFENDPQERLDAMRRTNRMIGEIVEKSGITAEEKAFAEKIANNTQYAANIPSTMDADRVVHLAWEYMIIKRMNAGEPPTALQRLGIRIASPLVNDYRDAPLLRAWDRDYYRAKSSTSEIISKYELEPKEIADARSIADGYHGIEDFREYSNFKRFAISELADAYALVDSLSKAGIPQQRAATVERFAKELEPIIDGIEYAHRRSPLRLTANTMTRNNLAVFGEEKGAKINALLFRPIQLNEAERMRFVNGQFDEFTRTFGKVTEAESAIAQKLIEAGTDAEEAGKFPTVDKLIESKTDEKRRADEKIEALEAEAAAKEQSREARNRKRKKLSDAKERSAQIEAQLAAFSEAVSAGVDFRRVLSISDYLRGKYAEFYEATNDFLVVHGYRPIGFIKNYAPHMQEKQMTELTEILKRFGLTDEVFELPTEIAGRTKDFKPGKKWNPFHQRRTGKNTVYDAVAGYDRYVRYMSEMFYHTDDIQKLRQFNQAIRTYFASDEIKNRIEDVREAMRKGTMEEDAGNAEIERLTGKAVNQNLSPYVAALDNYTNIIAGKQTAGDRGMESDLGRRTLNIGEKLEQRFSAAAIIGNVSSAFAQFVQLPMVAAECGNSNLLRAMRDILTRELNKKTDFDSRSVFITGKRGTNRLSTELTGKNKAADIAVNKIGPFLFETVDDLASRVIVRTKYLQLVNEGVNSDSALALADEYADSVVGSRMKGAKPIAFCNKNFVWKLLTTFQLEVANVWAHVDQDIPADVRKISRTQGKNAAAKYTAAVIVKYLLGAFLLNRLTDELYGQTPVPFDFAGYALDAAAAGSGMSTNTYLRTALDNTFEKLLKIRPLGTEKEEGGFNAHSALTALGEDVVGDMPVVQNAFGMLGLSDARLPVPRLWSDSASSALGKITSGDADVAAKGWRQFGSAALSNAATWFPFGNQLNKSIRGIYAIARKGSYDYSGRLQYPAGDSVFEKGAAVLFGKSAFNSNADFWAGGSRALSEEATEAYKLMLKYGMSQVEAYRLVKELVSQKADRAEKEEVDVSGLDGFDALAARYFTNDEAEGASGSNDFDTLAAKYFGEGDEDEEAEDLSRRVINRQIEIINSDKYDLTDEQKYRVFSEVCASSKAADVMAALDESGAERGEIYRLISSIAATKNTDEEPRAVAHLIKESKLTGEQKAIAYYALAASKKERQVQKELDDLGENSADVWEMLDSYTELRKNEADEDRFEKARRVLRESEISKKGKAEAYYLLAASAKDREFMDKVGGDFDMGEIADTLSRLRDCGKQGEKAQVLVDSSGLTVYEKRTAFLERVCTESNRAKKEEALEKIEDAGGSAETYLKALSAVGKATYTKGETLGKSYAYKKAIDRVARGTRLRYALYEVFGVSEKVW